MKAWFIEQGLSPEQTAWLINVIEVLGLILVAFVADWIAKQYILRTVKHFTAQTKNQWDDILVRRNVFTRLSHLAPALIIFFGISAVFPESDQFIVIVRRLVNAYMVLIIGSVLSSLINAGHDIYETLQTSRKAPIKGYVQAIKLILFFSIGLFVVSVLLNKSPWGFFSVLGGLTAVLLLVFKDTILGLVASVQLMANNMVSTGDWIEMPKYGADGDVIDVSLTTVKVQNWDKTISMIPTYALISDSFKNWRGMSESGGRRIKRSILIDMQTIKFLDEELLNRLKKIQLLKDYLERKTDEIAKYNSDLKIDVEALVNGRRLTNVGTLRAYIIAYLKQNPHIHQEGMTFLVRQLQPSEHGLPIEVYVFSKDQVWANYEAIQADIFDHILAAVQEFDLRVYQQPSGADFQQLFKS